MANFLQLSKRTERGFTVLNRLQIIFQYAKTILLDGFGQENKTDDDNDIIVHENRLIGPPRIRQVRVRNDSCVIHKLFIKQFKDCFGFYNYENEDFSPFGLEKGSAWTYSSQSDLGGCKSVGTLAHYPGGGYYQDLTFSKEENNKLFTKESDTLLKKNIKIILQSLFSLF